MDTLELIDKYIDKQLSQTEARQLEKKFLEDAELQQLLDSIIISRKAIRLRALSLKIKGLHDQYIDDIKADNTSQNGRVLPLSSAYAWVVRIAAGTLIGLIGYTGYEYATLDKNRIYSDKFISYQLPVTRGMVTHLSSLDTFYSTGNYTGVIQQFNTLPSKTPGDYFLTGIAHLQRKDYTQAINTFMSLRRYNAKQTESYFTQETDYYLALAYLGDGRIDEAYKLFNTIHDTPHHLFSESVTKIDLLKLQVLRSTR